MLNKTFDITNKTIHSLYQDSFETLNINPKWQRGKIWSLLKQRELIISIIRNIPIPAIYTYLNEQTGKEELLDGKQRLTTIFEFLDSAKFYLPYKLILDYELQDKFENFCMSTKEYHFKNLKMSEQNKFKNYKVAINVLRGDWDDSDQNDISYRVQRGVQHSNGENLYAKRQKIELIERMAIIHDNEFPEAKDKRKQYFNAYCKMYYLFCDHLRTYKPITNSKMNKFYDHYNEHKDNENNFIEVLLKFIQQFREYNLYKGSNGYVTMFAIWLIRCNQDPEKTKDVFRRLMDDLINKSVAIGPEPHMIHREAVIDAATGKQQSIIVNGKIQKK